MGLNSCSSSTRCSNSGSAFLSWPAGMRYFSDISFFMGPPACGRRAMSTIRSSRLGRNSCSGGSRVRITTGNPSIAVNRPAKSLRCHRQQFLQGLCGGSFFIARQNHSLDVEAAGSSAKEHVLSAHKPYPSAPNRRAALAFAWDIGVRTHAEAAAEGVGPLSSACRSMTS